MYGAMVFLRIVQATELYDGLPRSAAAGGLCIFNDPAWCAVFRGKSPVDHFGLRTYATAVLLSDSVSATNGVLSIASVAGSEITDSGLRFC